ncbi:TetR/AcrR family transcriptional regulator [Micromonospora avicenniae]|uniref:TetR/AcrR family transcriptional regulator n=1 Tax=Micromonospora avicenniae TaxID=1198245 RepID=UPI0034471F9E
MSDMTSHADAPRSPGRPRSTRADEAIIDATLNLLAEGAKIDTLSIEAIASRAGVGKATIYRRWPGKEALLRDALTILKGTPPTPIGRSVREDLVLLLGAVGRNTDPRSEKIMSCLLPEVNRNQDRYELYQGVVEPRRARVREVLERGVRNGELRADLDVELALALLTGPMLIQRVLRWHPELDDDVLAERVVDGVLEGIRAR